MDEVHVGVEDGGGEDEAVQAVEDAAVTGDADPHVGVLHAGAALPGALHQVAQLTHGAQEQAQGHHVHAGPLGAHRGFHQEGPQEVAPQVASGAFPALLGADPAGQLVAAKGAADEVGEGVPEPRDDEEGQDEAAAGLGQGAFQHEELLLEAQAEAQVEGAEPGDGLAGEGLLQLLVKEEGPEVDHEARPGDHQPERQGILVVGGEGEVGQDRPGG